jgi:hypothetical protein
MPLYEFRIKESGETFEEYFTYDEKKAFLEDNPEFEEIIGAPNIISGISGITHKTDSGFNDLLNRIGNANPHSPLGQQHGDKGIKATKVREAVNKARNKK